AATNGASLGNAPTVAECPLDWRPRGHCGGDEHAASGYATDPQSKIENIGCSSKRGGELNSYYIGWPIARCNAVVIKHALTIIEHMRATMSQVSKFIRRLGKDEEGAALIEYTVLLGILVVAVIATIVAVGVWVNGKWHALQQQLT